MDNIKNTNFEYNYLILKQWRKKYSYTDSICSFICYRFLL